MLWRPCHENVKKRHEKWCRGKCYASYKNISFSYGRDFWVEELKKDLNRVFENHAKNADVLSPNGITCTNNPFNIVASQVLKIHII